MTLKVLENIPENDPLVNPAQKAIIDQIIAANKSVPGATMVILNELQNQIGHISPSMQAYVAQELKVPYGAVHGVVSFYSFFTTQPRGRHTHEVLHGHGVLRGRHAAVDREGEAAAGHRDGADHEGRRDDAGSVPLRGRVQSGAGHCRGRRSRGAREAQQAAAAHSEV